MNRGFGIAFTSREKMELTLKATCPSCQKKYPRIRKELIGKKAMCTCGHTFRLGQDQQELTPTESGSGQPPESLASDSVDLSSESVFENSYSDLDQILSGHGSTAPVPTAATTSDRDLFLGAEASTASAKKRVAPDAKARQPSESEIGYRSTGMSVGFIAAFLSGCLAVWFSLLVLSSRFAIFPLQPLNLVSQTLHDMSRGTFGDLSLSAGLERSFILLSWAIWIAAACLIVLAAAQLINAFVKLLRGRRLLPGIDGITGLTAVVLLFMLLSTLFIHFSHMRQLNRELVQNAGGQIDEDTVLGRNFLELQSTHAKHSRQFMTSILVTSSLPLCVCLLSLSRVYITLGEPDFRSRQ